MVKDQDRAMVLSRLQVIFFGSGVKSQAGTRTETISQENKISEHICHNLLTTIQLEALQTPDRRLNDQHCTVALHD